MANQDQEQGHVRPRTAVLTRGFNPSLSLGSARPAVFRSSTYVFESPEAAEGAFAITTGKIKPADGERADLIYSRFSHPNAEILEDQIVPLEAGARHAAVFNAVMMAAMPAPTPPSFTPRRSTAAPPASSTPSWNRSACAAFPCVPAIPRASTQPFAPPATAASSTWKRPPTPP